MQQDMFNGRVAIVTGAAGGLGSETARLLAARGATVVIADIAADRAEAVAQEIVAAGQRALAVDLDLRDEASINRLLSRTVGEFGRLDILVNNAALQSPEIVANDLDIQSMSSRIWDEVFTTNCRGTMLVTKAALPHLVESRGAIVNLVSNLAFIGHSMQSAYSASKAAIIQLTRSVAATHSPKGVRCNAVAPGMTMTPTLMAAFPENLRHLVEEETLRERLANPLEVAEVIAFVASDASRAITGQTIVADGGFISHFPGMHRFNETLRESVLFERPQGAQS